MANLTSCLPASIWEATRTARMAFLTYYFSKQKKIFKLKVAPAGRQPTVQRWDAWLQPVSSLPSHSNSTRGPMLSSFSRLHGPGEENGQAATQNSLTRPAMIHRRTTGQANNAGKVQSSWERGSRPKVKMETQEKHSVTDHKDYKKLRLGPTGIAASQFINTTLVSKRTDPRKSNATPQAFLRMLSFPGDSDLVPKFILQLYVYNIFLSVWIIMKKKEMDNRKEKRKKKIRIKLPDINKDSDRNKLV